MINGKKVMGLTLARGGSKRVPRKNVIDINGKPLIQYTIDEVKKSKYIDHYVVSTDDEDIKKLCRELEQTYFDRSPADDTQKSSDGLLEVLKTMDKPDYIVEIMCTNPLKTVEDIEAFIYIKRREKYIEKFSNFTEEDNRIGNAGIATDTGPTSPIQAIIQHLIGVEIFYTVFFTDYLIHNS